jgi:acyl carrier protein
MPTKDVAAKVKQIVCHELMLDEENLKNTDSLKDDHGMDSLDAVEMVMSLEENFDIHISDDEAEKLQTVNDAIKLVESKGVRQ